MFKSTEGAEDDTEQARVDVDAQGINARDVVCGIAASRRTPYVVSAVNRARELGAKTIYVTTNPRSEFDLEVDVAICPEGRSGSTHGIDPDEVGYCTEARPQHADDAAMVKLGKVYENMMVDLQLTNRKLVERAKRIISLATGVSYERASGILDQSGGHVKTAIVMAAAGIHAEEARNLVAQAGGTVRGAIALTSAAENAGGNRSARGR